MSWPQWGTGTQPPLPGITPAASVVNAAPTVMPPGMQYTPDQWAQLQQQNWNQWAQWQQQYQQWHQQYGAEYQKSLNALNAQVAAQQPTVPTLPNMTVPPPLPVETKPPLPTEPPPNYNPTNYTSSTSFPPPTTNYTTQPPPPIKPNPPSTPALLQDQVRNNNWSTPPPSTTQNNKRPYDPSHNYDREPKRQMLNSSPQWSAQLTQKPPPLLQNQPPPLMQSKQSNQSLNNPDELSEAEKKFDKQFAEWEEQFNKWKEQNAEHPDKEQYREYEKKWETWRAQLLERREQMKKKRLALYANKKPQQQGVPPINSQFTKPPPAIVKPPPLETPPSIGSENSGFLSKLSSSGGIPGLDLVANDPAKPVEADDVILVDSQKRNDMGKLPLKEGPDFDAISKGINTILGDQKILNMLSLVSQNQPVQGGDSIINTVTKIRENSNQESIPQQMFNDQSNLSHDEYSNQSEGPNNNNNINNSNQREFVNNFDDQTRSSFTMGQNDSDRFDQPPPIGRNTLRFEPPPPRIFDRKNFSKVDFQTPSNRNNDFRNDGPNRFGGSGGGLGFNEQRRDDRFGGFQDNRFGGGNNRGGGGGDDFENRYIPPLMGKQQDDRAFSDINRMRGGPQFDEFPPHRGGNSGSMGSGNDFRQSNFDDHRFDYNDGGEERLRFEPGPGASMVPPPRFEPNTNQEPLQPRNNDFAPENPSADIQTSNDILEPATVIDYDHKPLKSAEPEILIEPIRMFDYRHKPLSRIPLPQRPKWLSDTVRNIREFDPPVVRSYELPNLRRYPPPPQQDNWRNDRSFQDDWSPSPIGQSSSHRRYNSGSDNHRNTYDERTSNRDRSGGGGGDNGGNEGLDDNFDDFDESSPPPSNERSFNRSHNDDRMLSEESDRTQRKNLNDDHKKNERTSQHSSSHPQFPIKHEINKSVMLIEDLINPPGRHSRPPRIVIILRGPPGSGKTYLAKLIKDKEVENGGSAPRILSLDDYFMVEQEKEIVEDGKKVKVKDMVYEYEAEMEESYRISLVKSFKKTVTDGFFSFIIVDNVNDKVKYFGEMWSFAKQNGFQVYICQLDLDVHSCSKRNIHGRTEAEIEKCVKGWEPTPNHHPTVDATSLLQSGSIREVEMEEVNSPESDEVDENDAEEDDQVARSKWDNFDCSIDNLAKLDGVAKPLRPSRTMEEYLQMDTDWTPKLSKPGQKRVRWADLEEQKQQEKMRAIGFVVGQTDWGRMMDPTMGGSALTQTKYIERTSRF